MRKSGSEMSQADILNHAVNERVDRAPVSRNIIIRLALEIDSEVVMLPYLDHGDVFMRFRFPDESDIAFGWATV